MRQAPNSQFSRVGTTVLTLPVPDVLQGYRDIAHLRGTATNRTAVLRADARGYLTLDSQALQLPAESR